VRRFVSSRCNTDPEHTGREPVRKTVVGYEGITLLRRALHECGAARHLAALGRIVLGRCDGAYLRPVSLRKRVRPFGAIKAFTILTNDAALWYYNRRLAGTSDALISVLMGMALTKDEKQRETAGVSLLFRPSVARKPRISAENERPLAVNFVEEQRKTARSAHFARIAFE